VATPAMSPRSNGCPSLMNSPSCKLRRTRKKSTDSSLRGLPASARALALSLEAVCTSTQREWRGSERCLMPTAAAHAPAFYCTDYYYRALNVAVVREAVTVGRKALCRRLSAPPLLSAASKPLKEFFVTKEFSEG